MELRQLMVPAAEEVIAVVVEVAPDRLSGPTPCPEFDVRALLAHMDEWTGRRALAAARKEPATDITAGTAGTTTGTEAGTETATEAGTTTGLADRAAVADPDWTKRYTEAVRASASAWSEPAAWRGETGLIGGARMPAEFIGGILFGELLLHGWDLAVAVGQPYAPGREASEALLEQLSVMGEMARQGGVFGPAVPVPSSAKVFDRALGLAGRDPAWTPDTADA